MNNIKTFLIKSFIFSIPIVLWVAVVVIVDPFNYFDVSHVVPKEAKINAKALNTLLYNILEERHSPCTNLLIGDSRTANLPIGEILKLSGERYFLLTSNALKLNEIVDLFWLANSYKTPRNVYIGINFSMFNYYGYADRVTSVKSTLNNPLIYIFNTNTAEAIYYVIKACILNKKTVHSQPPMAKEEFWTWNLNVKAYDWYGKYEFPAEVYDKIKKMVDFARINGINITYIILPHHLEFQQRVKDYNLTAEKIRFMRAMLALNATVIDYDFDNEITRDKNNFSDPVHYNTKIGMLIVDEIFQGPLKIGKALNKDYVDHLAERELR